MSSAALFLRLEPTAGVTLCASTTVGVWKQVAVERVARGAASAGAGGADCSEEWVLVGLSGCVSGVDCRLFDSDTDASVNASS